VGTALGLLALARFMGSVPFLKKLIRTEDMSSATLVSPEQATGAESELVGKTGRTLTLLRPAGRAEIDGEPVDVVAEGAYIPKGTTVEVTAVRGRRLVVKPAQNV
jgi:membrane-bound serine protease (ClpP class)